MMSENATEQAQPESQPVTGLRRVAARLVAARWLWLPVALFLITRLVVALVAYLSVVLLPASTTPPVYHLRPPDNIVLDVLGSRWDTGFYDSIVEEGYQVAGVEFPSVAFFPLMPLAMWALLPLTGDAVTSGILVANAALLAAAILLYRLAALNWGAPVADRAVWYLLVFPAAFFGSAIYTESLFLLCAIGALYAARRNRWWLVGIFAFAATLTRFVGLIVVPMLLLEWWLQQAQEKPPAKKALLAPLLAPLGTLSYMIYLQWRFADPLAFLHASAAWGRAPQAAVETIAGLLTRPEGGWTAALLAGHIHVNDWMDLLFVALFLALGFVLLYQHRWSEGIFVWLGALIPLSSGLLMSQRRYMWVLFPVYILLAQWGRHLWFDRLVTALFLIGLGLFTALFAGGYWVG